MGYVQFHTRAWESHSNLKIAVLHPLESEIHLNQQELLLKIFAQDNNRNNNKNKGKTRFSNRPVQQDFCLYWFHSCLTVVIQCSWPNPMVLACWIGLGPMSGNMSFPRGEDMHGNICHSFLSETSVFNFSTSIYFKSRIIQPQKKNYTFLEPRLPMQWLSSNCCYGTTGP